MHQDIQSILGKAELGKMKRKQLYMKEYMFCRADLGGGDGSPAESVQESESEESYQSEQQDHVSDILGEQGPHLNQAGLSLQLLNSPVQSIVSEEPHSDSASSFFDV